MSDTDVESPEHPEPTSARTVSVRIPIPGLRGQIALAAVMLVILLGLAAWFTGPTRAAQQEAAAQSAGVASAAVEASKSAETKAAQDSASASYWSSVTARQSSEASASSIASVNDAAAAGAAEDAISADLMRRNPKAHVSSISAIKDPATGEWVVALKYYADGADGYSTTHPESHRVRIDTDGTVKVLS